MFDNILFVNTVITNEHLIGLFLHNPLMFFIVYHDILKNIKCDESTIDIFVILINKQFHSEVQIEVPEEYLSLFENLYNKLTKYTNLKTLLDQYMPVFTPSRCVELLIKSNGDFNKMNYLLQQEIYEDTLDTRISPSLPRRANGGGNKKQKGGTGVVVNPTFMMGLFESLADAIDTDDFDNDSQHDNLTTTNFSGENKAIKDAKLQGGEKGSLFEKLNENGRFIKVDMKTGISSETPLEGLESINFLVDAGGGFFKGLPDKDPCSSTENPTLTTKYISNYTDPASTGKGLFYRCFNEIGGGGPNATINGANTFINYCLAFTGNIIENSIKDGNNGGLDPEYYQYALNFLGEVTVEEIIVDKFYCNYVDKMSQKHAFYWLGNQSVMARWINDAFGVVIAAPRSSVTGGYEEIKAAYREYISSKQPSWVNSEGILDPQCVLALCRILKYMGDKSHIVAAVLMIKLTEQPFIIQTIDRLLAKCVVQVIEFCRTVPDYQFISQNLGVMLTNARKAPVITHTLACYNDVSGNNECKGTESAIFTYYTSDPVAIKIKWIDTLLESYKDTQTKVESLADVTIPRLTEFPDLGDYNLISDETEIQSLITTIKGSPVYITYKSALERIKLGERIEKITKLSKILPLTFSPGRSGIRLQNGPVVKAHYFNQLSKFNELLSLTIETINEGNSGYITRELAVAIATKADIFKNSYDGIYNLVVADDDTRGNYNMIDDPTTLQLQIFQNALGYGRDKPLPIQVYTEHPGLSGLASSSAKKYAGQVAKSYVDELTSIYELCCKLEQAPATAPAPEAAPEAAPEPEAPAGQAPATAPAPEVPAGQGAEGMEE